MRSAPHCWRASGTRHWWTSILDCYSSGSAANSSAYPATIFTSPSAKTSRPVRHHFPITTPRAGLRFARRYVWGAGAFPSHGKRHGGRNRTAEMRLAYPAIPPGHSHTGTLPAIYPAFARRVQLRQAIIREVSECLDQRPDHLLPGEWQTSGDPEYRAQFLFTEWRRDVSFFHA